MKYSFYESHGDDDIGKDKKTDITDKQAPRSNKNVHQFYQVTEESGDSKGKTDASKNEHQHGKTPTPRSVIHFPSENAHDVKNNNNEQDHTSGKKVHQFYEPSEVSEDKFSPLGTFPRKAVQDDVIAAREQEPLSNKNVHQFYQPSDEPKSTTLSLLHSLPVDNTEDVNANEQEPWSNSNVQQFYQTSGEPNGSKEKTNAPEDKKVHQFYVPAEASAFSVPLFGGFPTKAAQDDVIAAREKESLSNDKIYQFYQPSEEATEGAIALLGRFPAKAEQDDGIAAREKESSSNDKIHQFYQPSGEAGCDFSLFDSFSVKNTQDVNVNAIANKRESPPNKNVHQFYQSVETVSLGETAAAAARFDRHSVENTQNVVVNVNKQESPPHKNVHQFYLSEETREDNNSHPVERINTDDASSLDNDVHQCLDNVFNNMDEICHQEADAQVSDTSLYGAPLFAIGSTKDNFYEQSGDSCCPAEEIVHDAKKDSKGPESSPSIKSFRQLYRPSDESKNTITLSVKDISTRSARKAHLTSLNLKTVESLALLQSYHESKRSEVRLLDKYGLGSAASN